MDIFMKRNFFIAAIALMTMMCVKAQNIPAGMRMEVIEVGQDDNEYSIFQYKDPEGTTGYYLSLGHVTELLSMVRDDITDASFSHISEVCLPLGSTKEDVLTNLDKLLELFNQDKGTTAELACRLATGSERLGDESTATYTVVKRFLQGKRLSFQFTSGRRTAQADLTKSVVKQLKFGVKLDRKMS
jgi:hypothetical protein